MLSTLRNKHPLTRAVRYSPAYRQPKNVATRSMPQGMMTATCSPLILAFTLFSFSTMNAAILSALLCSVMQLMERVVWPCSGGIREEGEGGRGRKFTHSVCVPVFYVSCAHTVCTYMCHAYKPCADFLCAIHAMGWFHYTYVQNPLWKRLKRM